MREPALVAVPAPEYAAHEGPSLELLARPSLASARPFVPELADLPVEELGRLLGRCEVAKLSFNENPYGPSPKAVEAMQKAAAFAHLYQDSTGTALRQALSRAVGVHPGSIILSNGADEMIMLAALTFLAPGDEVVIPSPTFGQYAASAKLMGAVPTAVPLRDFRVDVRAVIRAVTERTKLVFVCNPNNPTGTILAKGELEQLLSGIPDNVIVAVDEAYVDYVTDPSYEPAVSYLDRHPNILVIRTFSKLHGLAGARVGLSEKDIIPVNMTAGDAGAAFVAGRVDAAVTWEPWLTKGSSGAGHVLVSTKDFPGVISDSISFHADYVKKNPGAVAGFVKAMKDAMDYWKKNPEESIQIMAKGLGISVDEFKATMEGLKFFDYKDNLAFFGTAQAPGPIYTTMQNAADFYSELGIIPSKPKVKEIIDSQFLH